MSTNSQDPALVQTSPIPLDPNLAPQPVSFSKHHADRSEAPQSRKQAKSEYSQPKFSYTREQKGHSLTLHLLLGAAVLWLNVVYISCSPRHYWHA